MRVLHSFFAERNAVLVFIALCFFIFGTVAIFLGLKEVQASLFAQKHWKKTQGKIMTSKIEHSYRQRQITRPVSVSYVIYAKYSFIVSGQEYVGNRLTFAKNSRSYHNYVEANSMLALLSAGKTVDVYFSPKDPRQSVLDTSIQTKSYILILFGLVFMGVAISAYFFSRPTVFVKPASSDPKFRNKPNRVKSKRPCFRGSLK